MNFLGLGTTAGRFRFFAVLEAVSWLGLLIGMAFKHIPEIGKGPEIGVQIFGPIHGGVFVLFVLVALLTSREYEWNWKTTVLALLSSIPPFFTVLFEVWAVRTGKFDQQAASGTESAKTLAASS